MRYLSLFTGIGGFEKGINQAYESLCNADGSEERGIQENTQGDEGQGLFTEEGKDTRTETRPTSERPADRINQGPLCIGYSEIDKYATQIYQSHFPEHKNYGDITKINESELPDFELLCGGFPCQSFSIAGKRGGFNDTRGTLFFDIARILKAKQPRLLLLENVKGLLSHEEGRTFATIITTLDELGYDLQWQVLNSKNFGVPQNRERVFIVGHLRGTSRPEVFPIRDENQGTIREITKGVSDSQRIYNSSGISKTLAANGGGEGAKTGLYAMDNMSVRRLTPKECERLQGFPDNWTAAVSDTQRYKCCGNAVTVNVIAEIMKRMFNNEKGNG